MEDHELIAKLRNEETRNYGFNLLVRTYQERVYWHVRKMVIDHADADDLTQETFVKVFNNLDKFKGESQLFTWVYRIATNECLTFLKKKKRRSWLSFSDEDSNLENLVESNLSPDAEVVEMKLQKAILRLPEKQRAVFNMKYFEELKYDEISAIMETSVGALKASYHHAVKKIEDYISKTD